MSFLLTQRITFQMNNRTGPLTNSCLLSLQSNGNLLGPFARTYSKSGARLHLRYGQHLRRECRLQCTSTFFKCAFSHSLSSLSSSACAATRSEVINGATCVPYPRLNFAFATP